MFLKVQSFVARSQNLFQVENSDKSKSSSFARTRLRPEVFSLENTLVLNLFWKSSDFFSFMYGAEEVGQNYRALLSR